MRVKIIFEFDGSFIGILGIWYKYHYGMEPKKSKKSCIEMAKNYFKHYGESMLDYLQCEGVDREEGIDDEDREFIQWAESQEWK